MYAYLSLYIGNCNKFIRDLSMNNIYFFAKCNCYFNGNLFTFILWEIFFSLGPTQLFFFCIPTQ